MIDVGAKKDTKRIAKAQAYVKLNAEIVRLILADKIPKGNVLEQGDWSLLDPVRARPKMWRDVAGG